MYLRKIPVRGGRYQLAIIQNRRDPVTGKTKKETVQGFGYLDMLEKEYEDPIAHFTEVLEQMKRDQEAEKAGMSLRIDKTHMVSGNERKNVGYVALSEIYHELEINKFLKYRQQYLDVDYNLNSIMRLLVFSRLLAPGSKKKAYDEREWFFERSDFTLVDMYRALSRFADYGEALQLWMHERITAAYGCDTSTTYYDDTPKTSQSKTPTAQPNTSAKSNMTKKPAKSSRRQASSYLMRTPLPKRKSTTVIMLSLRTATASRTIGSLIPTADFGILKKHSRS